MQVTVETTSGLERRLRVEIPAERIQGEIDKRLGSLAREVRVPGFRPGKVPVRVVRQRFGQAVRDEVFGDLVQSSFQEAVQQENLQLAGSPTIDPLQPEPDGGLAYTATFDVYPEITLPDLDSLTVARPSAEITEADVDAMLETLRAQRRDWVAVERAATESDQVVVDFEGTMDGVAMERGNGKEVPVELTAGRMIPGFESGLVGASAGEQRTLELAFPEDYAVAELAGRPARFEVTVHRVEEPVVPALDDAFAEAFGVKEGGIEALRREARANMERELGEALRARTKERVMDALLGGGDIEVPASMVRSETERAFEARRLELAHSGIDAEQIGLTREMLEDTARRRVALGLLLGEIIKATDIQPDPERVRERIEGIASTYEDPNEVIAWYYSDRERLADVESTVLEDQVVEHILSRARVTDDPTSFDEVLKRGQTS